MNYLRESEVKVAATIDLHEEKIKITTQNPNGRIISGKRKARLTSNIIVETNERAKRPRPMIPNPHGRIQDVQCRETMDTIFGQCAARIGSVIN